jgi:1,4-dihydroxy-2-naphthoyl-CoA hydrolase
MRPLAVSVGGLEVDVDLISNLVWKLIEEVISHQGALGAGLDRVGRERVAGVKCPLTHRRAVDREDGGDVVIAAPTLQHHLQHGALVSRKILERAHEPPKRSGGVGRSRVCEPVSWALVSVDIISMLSKGFDGLYGLEILEATPELGRAQVKIHDRLKQPFGLVHGGVYASIAESLASVCTGVTVFPEGKTASGLSNQTSFLRPMVEGTIHAVAVRKHAGRTTWVWEVEQSDDQGRLCVLTRMTIAIREASTA